MNNLKKENSKNSGISKETWRFIKQSNEFLKKHNIKPKEFNYQSGLSFKELTNKDIK